MPTNSTIHTGSSKTSCARRLAADTLSDYVAFYYVAFWQCVPGVKLELYWTYIDRLSLHYCAWIALSQRVALCT